MGIGSGDRQLNEQVLALVEEQIDAGLEIGMQVSAYIDGRQVVDVWAGKANIEQDQPVGPDTLFNVYSVTKALVATALHVQADRGLVDYDAPMARYWPEYAAHGKDKGTVRDSLTHRSGVPQMPPEVTPELMIDWGWITGRIADSVPMETPGSTALYQALTFGWLVGEIVRRTDPKGRRLGQFILDEIATPLGAPDLYVGVPESEFPRIAKMYDTRASQPGAQGDLYLLAAPLAVDLVPAVFERADVRQGEVPGVGGIMSARSEARMWAMLANGGALDGVRLLSEEIADGAFAPRANPTEPDRVMYNIPLGISQGGYWMGADRPAVWAAPNSEAICHPGAGNSFGWAHRGSRSALAICHNRLAQPQSKDIDAVYKVSKLIQQELGVPSDLAEAVG